MYKKLSVVALTGALAFSGLNLGTTEAAKPENAGNGNGNNGKVENVIYMIPDGFSADYAANYRTYKGEKAIWEEHLKGMFTTFSANSDTTDSAAAGTAMATGIKTNNGVIGLDAEGNKIETILEAAEKNGKSTGLVATSTISHATPAAFAAHVDSRNKEAEISRQLVDSDVDVMLGGGKSNFLPKSEGGNQEERHLINEAEEKGFEFVETRDELVNVSDLNVEDGDKLLGLFAGDSLAPELQRGETEEPSLADMTEAAIDVLEEDKDGFFLVVEGSQIDWAGHDNDAAWAMSDVAAFEKAVEIAMDFAKKDGKTLVVVAGDHDTGGMTTGGSKVSVLQNVTATGDTMASKLNSDRSNVREVVERYTGLPLSESDVNYIKEAKDASYAINTIVSKHASIGWTSTNHTAADIPLYVYGPQSQKFVGFHDNTDLPKLIAETMKFK